VNGKDRLDIFLYIINPPKLRLKYIICATDNKSSLITIKKVPADNFFYEHFLDLKSIKQKVAIVVNKYDSTMQEKRVIIKYLKTAYP